MSSQPNAIATGPDGSLWITESAAAVSKIGLINIAAKTVTEFGTGLTSPTVIVPGPDGNMWFTENGGAGHVAEINPVTHDITEFCHADGHQRSRRASRPARTGTSGSPSR